MGKNRSIPFVPIFILTCALLYAVYNLFHVLTPFILSLAAAYMLNPAITHFEVLGLRRDPVVLGFYLSFAVLLSFFVVKLLPRISDEWSQLQTMAPTYVASTQRFLGAMPSRLAHSLPAGTSKNIEQKIEQGSVKLYDSLLNQFQHLPTYLMGLFPLLSLFFLVPFITFFFLMDGNRGISGMIQACPSRYVEQALYLISEIDTSLGNYLRGIIIEAMIVTFIAYIGLLWLGIDHSLAISIMTGVSSFAPYLGAVIGATVGGVAAMLQFGTLMGGLKVVALFAGIRFVDDWLLQPLISKHSVHLHPMVFLLSLMVGGELLGFIGIVFAVPTACVIKSLFKVAWDWYTTENLRNKNFEHLATGVIPYT